MYERTQAEILAAFRALSDEDKAVFFQRVWTVANAADNTPATRARAWRVLNTLTEEVLVQEL